MLTAVACRTPRAPAAPAPQPPAPDVVAPAPDVAAAPDAAPAPDAPVDAAVADAPLDPLVLRIRALAGGTEALAAAVDPARGLVVARYLEAPPSGQGGERHTAQRLCGATLTRSAAAVRRDLAAAVAQAEGGDGFVCQDRVCVAPGMEYQPEWRVHFEDVQGTLRLTGVAQVSVAAIADAWVARANAYVDRAFADARRTPCR